MLYIIGLGLNVDGISKYGLEIVKRCKRVYLENYTVDFPYSKEELAHILDKKLISADREKVESLELVDEAKKMDIAFLVYGSPLTATTHISLIEEAKRLGVRYKVIYNASIIDAVAETGLQLYKFGKIASMPKWNKEKNFTPDSFIEIIKDNQKINAHTLLLADIGLDFNEALEQLIKAGEGKIKINKIVVCSRLGASKSRIFYDSINNFKENIEKPYCIVIPSKLHFMENEVLSEF